MCVSSQSSCWTAVAFRFAEDTMTSPVDEALELGVIARKLYLALRHTDCLCVETEEYKLYNTVKEWFLAKNYPNSTPEEMSGYRLLYLLNHPFEGEQVQQTCDRCSAMEAYEGFIGEEHLNLYLEGRE